MSTDRQSIDHQAIAWAKQFRAVYADLVESLGGESSLSPLKRSACRTIATLMAEAETLQGRFANGRSDTSDLNTFLKLTSEANDLLRIVGLDQPQEQREPVGGSAIAELERVLGNMLRASQEERRAEEQRGVFHTIDGVRVTKEMVTDPEPSPPPAEAVADHAKPGQATIEKSSTEKYLQWAAGTADYGNGAGWDSMSPPASWSRIR